MTATAQLTNTGQIHRTAVGLRITGALAGLLVMQRSDR